MKLRFSRVCGVILSLFFFLSGPSVGPAKAEFTLLDVAGAWYFYVQRGVGKRNAACQVVTCVGGNCTIGGQSKIQFSLYDERVGLGIWPEFIAPRRVPPGAVAKVSINGTTYQLRNTFKSRQYYQLVETKRDAVRIVDELRKLERSDRNGRFSVTSTDGRVFEFQVRGVNESLDRMSKRCTPRS